ncbi:MAG: hypothetical protein KBC73_21705 [Burkholderiaceae bacterium]|nr:hypothetical protein [Burkholderiaceae bacterium]
MTRFSPLSSGLLRPLALATLLALPALASAQAAAPAVPASAAAAPTVRAETAKPLQAAQEALRAGQHADALARLAEAEAVAGTTPYEAYLIARMKAVARFSTGDVAGSVSLFESTLASSFLPADDRQSLTETTVKLALQLKDYPRALKWVKAYLDAQGPSAELRRLYPQLLAVTGDHAGAAREMLAQIAAEQAAGRPATEATLRLLAGSQAESKDDAGYLATLTQLASLTGKPEYWRELVQRQLQKEGFAADKWRLDLYRLRQAVGVPLNAGEQADWAERAMRAGLPGEAQKVIEAAFASKALGDAADERKLRDAIVKAANADRGTLAADETAARNAKDGNAALRLGFALSGMDQHERALSLMAAGIAKGGLRQPDEAQLRLGLAQVRAGKADEAQQSFAAVKGTDGSADVARLWLLYLKSPARK